MGSRERLCLVWHRFSKGVGCCGIHHSCWVGAWVWRFQSCGAFNSTRLRQRPALAQHDIHCRATKYGLHCETRVAVVLLWHLARCSVPMSACLCYLLEMEEKDFGYILRNLVHPYCKFEYVQEMYKNNIFPACIDNVKYDGVTRPPAVTKRQSGRPQSNQLCRQSEFLDPEESLIKCSDCGQRGHNKRTCKNQIRTL